MKKRFLAGRHQEFPVIRMQTIGFGFAGKKPIYALLIVSGAFG